MVPQIRIPKNIDFPLSRKEISDVLKKFDVEGLQGVEVRKPAPRHVYSYGIYCTATRTIVLYSPPRSDGKFIVGRDGELFRPESFAIMVVNFALPKGIEHHKSYINQIRDLPKESGLYSY